MRVVLPFSTTDTITVPNCLTAGIRFRGGSRTSGKGVYKYKCVEGSLC